MANIEAAAQRDGGWKQGDARADTRPIVALPKIVKIANVNAPANTSRAPAQLSPVLPRFVPRKLEEGHIARRQQHSDQPRDTHALLSGKRQRASEHKLASDRSSVTRDVHSYATARFTK